MIWLEGRVRTALLAVACALATAGASSWRVERVSVEGLPKGLKPYLGFAIGDTADDSVFSKTGARLMQYLADFGFLRARVTIDTTLSATGVSVRYAVDAGLPVRVARWQLSGDDTVAGRPATQFLPRSGVVFSRKLLERAISGLLAAYEHAGHPLAEVAPVGVRDSAEHVVVELAVSAGPHVQVSFLEFSGVPRLPGNLLNRLARFTPGRTYSPVLARFWGANLDRSSVLRVTGQELVRGDGFGVRYRANPLRANHALAAAGYSSADRVLTGYAEFKLDNILNTGRRLAVGWRGFSRKVVWQLGYTEPWVFVPWLWLGGSFRHDVFDTTASRTNLSATAGMVAEAGPVVTLSTGLDRVASIDTQQTSSTTWVGTGIRLETSEPGLNVRRGAVLDVRTTAGNRTSRTKSGFVGRVETDASVAGPSAGSLSLVNSAHYRLVYSEAGLSRFEWYRLGGAKTLRGYREDEFAGPQLGWWNCEVHWSLGRTVVGYPFFDAGACEVASGRLVRFGYGLGLRAETGLGTIEISYGTALGDSPLLGKVHLSFAAGF